MSLVISPSTEYSGLISFRMDWLDLLAVQGTLKSLLQHHSSKASVLQCSAMFRASQVPGPGSNTYCPLLPTWELHAYPGCAPETKGDRQSPGRGPDPQGRRLQARTTPGCGLLAECSAPPTYLPQLRPPDDLQSHVPEWPSDVFSPNTGALEACFCSSLFFS